MEKKKTTKKRMDAVAFSPECAKKILLDPDKPITIEGKTSVFPYLFLGIALFFAAILGILFAANYRDATANGLDDTYRLFFIVVGVFLGVALGILIGYMVRGRRLRKEVLSMDVTNGIVTSITSDSHYVRTDDSYDKYTVVTLYYAFYDDT